MKLVNHTPVTARLTVTRLPETETRLGILMAKATFRYASGRTDLDTDAPLPVSREAHTTAYGDLPADGLPLGPQRFEVVVLGCAHAPAGTQVATQRVAVRVGKVMNELVVTGDRVWASCDGRDTMSDPEPFERMPLTWERAFGGSCDVEVDSGVCLPVSDPANPHGRGFDPARLARRLTHDLGAPHGYPRVDHVRRLPNLEYPGDRIAHADDVVAPACWAPVRPGSALSAQPLLDEHAPAGAEPWDRVLQCATAVARDEWIIDPPARGAPITLEGLSPEQRDSFPLPDLDVVADYAVSERRGSLSLRPHLLVVLSEERRIVLSYFATFRLPYAANQARSIRLRIENGNGGQAWPRP